MSRDGHPREPEDAVIVATFSMPVGARFDWHAHLQHQLAWASSGVLTVSTSAGTWVLPPTRALWIPRGVPHETLCVGRTTMTTLYVPPGRSSDWTQPTAVGVGGLLAHLILHLDSARLEPAERKRAEALLNDLLQPVAVATIDVPWPIDERGRDVASALAAQPSDSRSLAEWGREVGASERTLARAFHTDTGITFGRWRTRLRLQAALPALAAGEAVAVVATQVGYASASAFVAAFRRETGLTPGAATRSSSAWTLPHRD